MRKLIITLMFCFAGCDSKTPDVTVLQSDTTPILVNAPVTAMYKVSTLQFHQSTTLDATHKELSSWIVRHPDERIVAALPYVSNIGVYGISIISTSTH